MKNPLTIGALAKATATNIETIRYYERIGLIPAPGRTSGNYRAYGPEHLARLSFVRRSRHLGFSLDAVRDLLRLSDQRRRDCSSVAPIARKHLEEVERKIADLTSLRRELVALMDQCDSGVITGCRVTASLSPMEAAAPSRRARP